MSYDEKAPHALIHTQEWFLEHITKKLDDTPDTTTIRAYISETKTLKAEKRLQLYAEDYWLRLIEVLHKDFPMLLCLFGEDDFTTMFCVPYLEQFTPNHWALSNLGDRFCAWVEKNYWCSDRTLVRSCAEIDWACQTLFYVSVKNSTSFF
jgi:hypothetical protein